MQIQWASEGRGSSSCPRPTTERLVYLIEMRASGCLAQLCTRERGRKETLASTRITHYSNQGISKQIHIYFYFIWYRRLYWRYLFTRINFSSKKFILRKKIFIFLFKCRNLIPINCVDFSYGVDSKMEDFCVFLRTSEQQLADSCSFGAFFLTSSWKLF